LLLRFLTEIPRDKRFDDVSLDLVSEALANHRGWHFAFAETRDTRELCITGDNLVAFAIHNVEGNFDGQFTLARVGGFNRICLRSTGFCRQRVAFGNDFVAAEW